MKYKYTMGERLLIAYWVVGAITAFLLPWLILLGLGIWLIGCAEPQRLDDPPMVGPLCAYEFEACGFLDTTDIPCCGEGVCLENVCYDPSRLVPPMDSCIQRQVDVALLFDRTGSMSSTFDLVANDVRSELAIIPATTEVQVWDFPHMRDGDYGRVAPPGGPLEAAETIELLPSPNPLHSQEASLDAAYEVLTGGYWRVGTTLRLVAVLSDEVPQSWNTPQVTAAMVCSAVTPADRLVVYTRPTARIPWEEACFEVRNLGNIDIGALIADPCSGGGE